MPVPADIGIAGHGDCEPGSHSLGAQGHGVLIGKFLNRIIQLAREMGR